MMGIMIYLLYTCVTADGVKFGPGLAAVLILFFSLAAKLYMSFAVRAGGKENEDSSQNASKAQLNVAEYEALFIGLFLFFNMQTSGNILVTVVSIVCVVAQAVYFWGRVVTGKMLPWAPLGALPRYACMIVIICLSTPLPLGPAQVAGVCRGRSGRSGQLGVSSLMRDVCREVCAHVGGRGVLNPNLHE